MITETELAAIDKANDERRMIVDGMIAGGWSYDTIRHVLGECGTLCPVCLTARAHIDCLGCPEC
ncbi:hypothetical protein [Streptomyces sp. MJM1172]|uniref:hypothetical protein n=1 Tax=Streptomyces sp. MJM1172 TaxID=1703926 RepID=UPI00093E505F|nr:hypothetical protein [Streptomyces sp. MJM1172]OKI71382.1 hypothetical protein AMK15_01780 [Streptomyces sp. MJM1172]